MLCYRLDTILAGGYAISRSVPCIVALGTAAHSFPWDTTCLYMNDCTMSYNWLLYGSVPFLGTGCPELDVGIDYFVWND